MRIIVGEDACGMADAAGLFHVADRHLDCVLEGVVALHGGDRSEDLLVQDVCGADLPDLQCKDLGILRDIEACSLCDDRSVLTDKLGIRLAVLHEDDLAELVDVCLVLEYNDARLAECCHNFFLQLFRIQEQVLAVAEDTIIGTDRLYGLSCSVVDVITSVQDDRRVARAYAVCRCA